MRGMLPRPDSLVMMVLAWLALGLLTADTAGAAWPWGVVKPRMVQVPNLVGMSQAKAMHTLQSLGLSYSLTNQATGNQAQNGTIARQSPAAGSLLPPGSKVSLVQYVKLPALATVTVPNVLNLTAAQAAVALSRAGLRAQSQAQGIAVSDRSKQGLVARQQPAAGQHVPRGFTVNLWLYALAGAAATTGPPPGRAVVKSITPQGKTAGQKVVVPNVAGLDLFAAANALKKAGLGSRFDQPSQAIIKASRGGKTPRVARQSPAAGQVVPKGWPVTLTLAK
ncbi:MAG: PASTA domain-containing protein [Thermodesulfobacteriota bacterium]